MHGMLLVIVIDIQHEKHVMSFSSLQSNCVGGSLTQMVTNLVIVDSGCHPVHGDYTRPTQFIDRKLLFPVVFLL